MTGFFSMRMMSDTKCNDSWSGVVRNTCYSGWLLSIALLQMHVNDAHAFKELHIVAPWRPAQVKVDVPALFVRELSQELKMPVRVNVKDFNQQEDALAWSLKTVYEQPSLVLLSEEQVLIRDADRSSPRHIAHYEPLMLVWQNRWCLFAKKNSPLQQPGALSAWVSRAGATPMIAIPEKRGLASLWVQGMEQRTKRKWKVTLYGLRGGLVHALHQGPEVALGYCSHQEVYSEATSILAQSGSERSASLKNTPLLSEVGWAPLSDGWLAWMVPKNMPVVQREAMAAALYRIASKPEVRQHLRSSGHVVQHHTPEMSKQHIENYTQTWRDIDALFSMRALE